MSAAKAVTAALVTLIMALLAKYGLEVNVTVVESIVGAIVNGALVYLVPNRPQPARTA